MNNLSHLSKDKPTLRIDPLGILVTLLATTLMLAANAIDNW